MKPIKSEKRQIGLLASEMATRGGMQSFMQRISDVISGVVDEDKSAQGFCLSLNDTTDALRRHPVIPSNLDVWGAAGSKYGLMAHALTKLPQTDVLFVGHLGVAPVAHLMKLIGRVKRYYVTVLGIEAWKLVTPIKRRALLGADSIIAISCHTAEECARHNDIPTNQFTVIPLCADERPITPSPDFRLKGEFKLLCVARLDATERYKGIEHIFEALKLLRFSHPQLHLNLVGDGDDRPRLKAIAADLGISKQVTFWGRQSDAGLAAAYQQCDVFVMPSEREGFGIVFLEAMRYGKPCIGGNHGGTPEVIVDGITGYLVNYGDVDTLSCKLCLLIENDQLRQSMGEASCQLVDSKFSYPCFRKLYYHLMHEE